MWNAGLDEAQGEIKIAGRNMKNHRYTDETTLIAESEEKLNSLLMKVKEESKHYQRNANQNHNEVPLHASQDGCYPKVYKQ